MAVEGTNTNPVSLEDLTINNFTITDEFITVPKELSCRDLARKLMEVPKGVIFALDVNGIPVGAVTAREFLISTMEGMNLIDLKAEDIMNTNIMEIGVNDPLLDVIHRISKFAPYAIVVKDTDGVFRGYFSPNDYREALKRMGL